MLRKTILLACILWGVNGTASAWFSKNDAGTSAAQFLKLGIGARAVGMGEAFGAVSDDSSAVYWNPAGLCQVQVKEISFTHCSWFENINHEYLAYVQPFRAGVIAGAADYLAVGDIQKIDNTGTPLNTSYAPIDASVTASYAQNILDMFAGINIKYISCTLESTQATAIACDVGVMRQCRNNRLSLGCVVQNIGSSMKFSKEDEPLPMNIKVASAYTLSVRNNALTVAFDVNILRDNEICANVGGEYRMKVAHSVSISPRAGYSSGSRYLEGIAGVSAGMGILVNGYRFDYAWASKGNLGQANYLSVSMQF